MTTNTNKQGWLTAKSGALYSQKRNLTPKHPGYAIPQPQDTLAGFQLNAPVHAVDAHIERMESDAAQEMFADCWW